MSTYSIYRIVNFRNGKMYIGQTLDLKRRKTNHWNKLRSGKHHSSALQNAYNKWGESAFYLEVLEKGLSENEVDAREIYWINSFDSFRHGYNRVPGGRLKGICDVEAKPCTWNEVEYKSIREAAFILGLSEPGMRHRIRNGYKNDSDLKLSGLKRIECQWNGIKYKSIQEACTVLGINRASMWERIQKGYKCDADLGEQFKGKPCRWNGIEYVSITKAAEVNNIKRATLSARLQKGYTCDSDLIKAA